MGPEIPYFMISSGEEKRDIQSENIDLNRLVYDNRERLKELAALNATTTILKKNKSIYETLYEICQILPPAWQYPENTVARLRYDEMEFTTPDFMETQWRQKQDFESIDGLAGTIEIFYTKEFPLIDEGPFLKEERNLIMNIASLIEGFLNGVKGREGRYITRERLKELSAINQTTNILRAGKPVDEALHQNLHDPSLSLAIPRIHSLPNQIW